MFLKLHCIIFLPTKQEGGSTDRVDGKDQLYEENLSQRQMGEINKRETLNTTLEIFKSPEPP
jgi:hypothetical protein